MKHTYALSALFVFTVIAAVATAQQPTTPPRGMAGMGPAMAEMGAIHELMVNHDRINRTVTNLADGIGTVTESDDPRIAKIIKEHVSGMDQRLSAGNDPGLPMESPALHSIFRNADKVHTSIQLTANGVIVVQTSADPETVAVLQKHASEVSDLVKGGMAAMHAAMMQNGMHGGMMGNPPKGETSGQSAVTPQVHDHESIAQMLIHAQTPPGVAAMKRLRAEIEYRFEETERGGRIRITTRNSEALSAIYQFLRFQITDHGTSDSGVVERR